MAAAQTGDTSAPTVITKDPQPTQPDTLRQRFRQRRRALTEQQQRAHASALAQHFQLEFRTHLHPRAVIATYLSSDGEIDPGVLNLQLWRLGHTLALPVVAGGRLLFAHYDAHTPLTTNRYQIQQPAQPYRVCTSDQIDMVLMPLVAFDACGNRLGMGGGYYDRYLGDLAAPQRPLLIGLAHECQGIERLQPAPWDVPLDAILSERRWCWFHPKPV